MILVWGPTTLDPVSRMQKYVEEGLHFWIQTIYIYIQYPIYISAIACLWLYLYKYICIYIYINIHISFIFHIWDPVFGMQEIIVGGGSTIVEPTIDSS